MRMDRLFSLSGSGCGRLKKYCKLAFPLVDIPCSKAGRSRDPSPNRLRANRSSLSDRLRLLFTFDFSARDVIAVWNLRGNANKIGPHDDDDG